MEASLQRHDRLLTQSPASLPSPKGWGGAESSKLLAVVTRPHPEAVREPTQSRLVRTKDAPIIQELPQTQELCVRNWEQLPNIYCLLRDQQQGSLRSRETR